MKPDDVSQFDWERHLHHDAIMAAIEQRGEWTRARITRRGILAVTLGFGSGAVPLLALALGHPGGWIVWLFLWLVPLAVSITLSVRNSPRRWYRRWNADHPQMGQYLAPDLTD